MTDLPLTVMPCQKKQAKKDDDNDDQKNPTKKGKTLIPGGTLGMGRGQPSDSGDLELDIDSAMLMKAKPLKFHKPALASKEQEVIRKPASQRAASALTAAVGHTFEDTTGSQPQEPPKPPKANKDNVWQGGEECEGEVWGCSPYPNLETALGAGDLQLPSTSTQGWEGEKSPLPNKFHYYYIYIFILFIIISQFYKNVHLSG